MLRWILSVLYGACPDKNRLKVASKFVRDHEMRWVEFVVDLVYVHLSAPLQRSLLSLSFSTHILHSQAPVFRGRHQITVLSYSCWIPLPPPTTVDRHAKMHSLLALSVILLSSLTLGLASPLEERQNACGQCSPFPTPNDNSRQCDQTTICVPQPGDRTYCACRGGYRGSGAYPPGDTSVQVNIFPPLSSFLHALQDLQRSREPGVGESGCRQHADDLLVPTEHSRPGRTSLCQPRREM